MGGYFLGKLTWKKDLKKRARDCLNKVHENGIRKRKLLALITLTLLILGMFCILFGDLHTDGAMWSYNYVPLCFFPFLSVSENESDVQIKLPQKRQ